MEFSDLDNIMEMQSLAKIILFILIISNFIIIFGLKYQINVIQKIKLMFNLKDIKKDISSVKAVLLIISHPEDSILYFSPTIKNLLEQNIKLKILCLSKNNDENNACNCLFKNGEKIKNFEEMSKNLKLEDNKIVILDEYKSSNISNEIKKFLDENNDIGTIITFDDNGTGINEHLECYSGCEEFLKNNREEVKKREINIFLLDSFNSLIKYTFLIPFIFFYFKEFGYIINNCFALNRWLKIQKNIEVTFLKKIKIFICCFSYFNSFTKVELK
jgi:hypothetical protein